MRIEGRHTVSSPPPKGSLCMGVAVVLETAAKSQLPEL